MCVLKKKLLFLIVVLLGIVYYFTLPDYEIHSSVSFSNRGTRETELNVIVYQYWEIEELAERIRAEHNMINGTPTKLKINMYYSEWSLRESEVFKTIIYE